MLIFFLTMQISCPRRDRWNIFGRQEAESLQARLENRRLNRCNVFQLGQNLDHVQVRQESIFHRINEKREWLTSFNMVCNQMTYMWQSRQSTRCCDGRWTWSTWRTSRPPPPSPPRRRNGTPHWSSPGCKWDFDQEVQEKEKRFWVLVNSQELYHHDQSSQWDLPQGRTTPDKGWQRGWIWIHFGQENVILSLDSLIIGYNYCAPCMEDRRGRPAEPSWRRPTDKKRSVAPGPDLDDNHDEVLCAEIDILVSKLLSFETFANFLKVSVSVSENLVSEKSLGFGKFGLEKKSRFRKF